MQKINIKIDIREDVGQKGIWQYSSYLSPLPENFHLSLGEGNTPVISYKNLILKREDRNPTGSLKDRGMAYQVSWALARGFNKLTIPSSGNAAISAAAYCLLAGLDLTVFVSPKIEKGKLEKLKKFGVKVNISSQAVSECQQYSTKNNCFNLRPSKQEFGAEGYQTIAFELAKAHSVIDNLFLPVSSGVSLTGIAKGFRKLGFLPKIHLCQPASLCPIASLYDQNYQPENTSLATALVAKITPLKNEIMKIIAESGGTGWVIENREIAREQKLLEKVGIITSPEGILAVAAFVKAEKSGNIAGKTVCLLTGKKYLL